jgi:hypothetical protein
MGAFLVLFSAQNESRNWDYRFPNLKRVPPMAKRARRPAMKFATKQMTRYWPGEILSFVVGHRVVRKETAIVDQEKFYRYTVNPGVINEFCTFWSNNDKALWAAVMRKLSSRTFI